MCNYNHKPFKRYIKDKKKGFRLKVFDYSCVFIKPIRDKRSNFRNICRLGVNASQVKGENDQSFLNASV